MLSYFLFEFGRNTWFSPISAGNPLLWDITPRTRSAQSTEHVVAGGETEPERDAGGIARV
jgi:hypothetical protein